MDKLAYINSHRIALDYSVFTTLTAVEIDHHLGLIAANAPYGNDPWG